MGNGKDARRQEPSGRRGKREQLGARRGPDERQTWTRWSEENGAVEDEFRRTPTWHAKCRISSSGRPLRFELWGARGDYALYLSASQRSKLSKEQHKRHMVYTGSGHQCGVIPYSSVVWWIASWADDDEQYKEEQPREGLLSTGAMTARRSSVTFLSLSL